MTEPLPTLNQLSAFLSNRNWTKKSGKKKLNFSTGEAFQSPDEVYYSVFENVSKKTNELIRLVIPVRPDGQIPSRYIENALVMLSDFYQVSLAEIAFSIRKLNIDVLFGIHPRNLVSLSRAHEIISNLKNVVAQAANAETNPKPYATDARGNKIVDDVNFGHTFAGSFGFRIECPLSTADRQMDLAGNLPRPLERRLLERLAFGLLTVEQSAQTNDIAPVCDNYRVGLTANICDAILELCEPSDTEPFSFRFEWSSLVPVNPALQDLHEPFKINAKKYALIREASDALKNMVVEPKTGLTGTIVGLSSDIPPLQKGLMAHRKITLLVSGGDFDKLRMQFEVSDQDYQLALEAHTKGRLVGVEGIPTQRGTHWRLEDHSGLEAL